MKLTDVDTKVTEDIGDWVRGAVAKTGILGSDEKLSAQQQETQKRIYDTGLKFFKNELSKSIERAVDSGFIKTEPEVAQQTTQQTDNTDLTVQVQPGYRIVIPKSGAVQYYKTGTKWYSAQNQPVINPESIQSLENKADGGDAREERIPQNNQPKKTTQRESVGGKFELLSVLLEERILNEQSTIGGFVKNFVDSQTSDFVENSEYENFISQLAKRAEQEYVTTGKIGDKTYKDMWTTIFNWSKLGNKSRTRSTSTSFSDTGGGDVNQNGIEDKDERIRWHDKITRDLMNIDPNDPRDLKKMTELTRSLAQFVKNSSKNK
jgi:hypothetical protein